MTVTYGDASRARIVLAPERQVWARFGSPSRRKRSLPSLAMAFGLGLTQAIQLPVIGYVSLLELCFMSALPFVLVVSRRLGVPRSVKTLILLLIGYGALGLVIDAVRKAEPLEAARQVTSTYLIIACILCMAILCARWPRHFRWFAAGCSLWAVLKFLLGPEITGGQERWITDPWSYGMGTGLPLLVLCLLPGTASRSPRIAAGAVLLVFVAVGLVVDARSTALLTLMTAVVLFTMRPVSRRGIVLTPARWVAASLMLALVGTVGLGTYTTLASRGILGTDTQRTYQMQFDNPHGAAAAIRPDFLVALEAMARRPLFGYGSSQEDAAEFVLRRAELVLQQGIGEGDLSLIDRGKIPSHSILLNAWIEVGLFGGLLWLYLLVMTVATLPAAATSAAPLAPMCLYLCLVNAWVIPFSPGPPRVDVALGLAVMFAFREQPFRRLEREGRGSSVGKRVAAS